MRRGSLGGRSLRSVTTSRTSCVPQEHEARIDEFDEEGYVDADEKVHVWLVCFLCYFSLLVE